MPYVIQMIENDSVLYLKYSTPLTAHEMAESDKAAATYLDAVPNTINIIVDVSSITAIPPMNARVKDPVLLKHPNAGKLIFVGTKTFTRVLGTAFAYVAGYENIHFAGTLDEGLVVAREVQPAH